MTKYAVCKEWEYNGRDDSDFYVVVYDTETRELSRELTGSTRYAGGFKSFPELPEEHRAAYVECLEATWIRRLTASAEHRIAHPKLDDLPKGTEVILTQAVRNRPRAETSVPCDKCEGSGHWTNPRNAADKRPCFACKGTGSRKMNKPTKGAMVVHSEGTRAEVVRAFENRSQYGTWDRGSIVILRTESGVEFRAPIDSVRLARELDPTVIRANARQRVSENSVYPMFATAAISLV